MVWGRCVCGAIRRGSGFLSWTGGSGDFGSVKSFLPLISLVDCGLVKDFQLFLALTLLSMGLLKDCRNV